ncbi:EpsG family protein [Fundicoccus sp. Sow4_H7]|uniref:EpsG family protein n=1 Tax=Fundicoccus sp. Sow4_H7 TaxID=3438784 RepID=UPI003F8FCB03
MTVFIITILIIILLYPLIGKRRRFIDGRVTLTNNKLYVYIVSIILISISGFRHVSIGIDTMNYNNIFHHVNSLSISNAINIDVEIGYQLYQILIGNISDDFQLLLVITSILYIGIVSHLIYKYSENPMISYLLFIFFDFYTFSLSGIRQTIAMSLIILAFMQIKEKKFNRFLFWTILASSFHITALVFLPSYWFNRFKLNRRNLLFLLLCGLLIFAAKDYLQVIMSSYARIEYGASDTGGLKLYFLMIITVIFGVLYRKTINSKNPINVYLLYMMISCVVIFPIIRYNPITLRLYYYSFIFMIVYVPNLFGSIKDKAIRAIGTISYLLIGATWFFTTIINSKQIIPYLFFWQR